MKLPGEWVDATDERKYWERLNEGLKTVKGWYVRTASGDDDLATLWPALSSVGLNIEQVIVAVVDDVDNDYTPEDLLGGVLVFHGGHRIAYVGEFTLIEPNRPVAKALINETLKWCQKRGITQIVFNVQDPHFASMAMRLGATLTGHSMLLTMRVMPYEQQHYPEAR
jgi:hypothetical protein